MWPENIEIEGKAEIYLDWKTLARISLMMILPLIIALFFESFIVKVLCWGACLSVYMSCISIQGPCVMAIIVGSLPWYVFFEWKALPKWLAIIAIIISLIEISYIQHRMRGIAQIREKENILL